MQRISPCSASMLRPVSVSVLPLSLFFASLCVLCPVETTREHFSYAITLDVPVFVVINKIDLCSKTSIQQTINSLTYLLKHGSGSVPLEAFAVEKKEDLLRAANMFVEKRICPIFAVSCLTGENIDLLKQFFNILPPRLTSKEQERLSQLPVEFRVSEPSGDLRSSVKSI